MGIGATSIGVRTGNITSESNLTLTDVTEDDVSTTKHGFAPKAPNDTTKFLRGDASWSTLPASGLSVAYSNNTGASTTSTSETTLVTTDLGAGTVTNGILIMAGLHYQDNEGSENGTNTATFNLKIEGVTVKTITLKNTMHGVATENSSTGTAIFYVDTSQTWANEITVAITGSVDDAGSGGGGVTVTSMVILKY